MRLNKIKELLKDNEEMLIDTVREINSWDGSLEHLDYQENDEDFFETYFEDKPMEVARSVCYGDYNFMDDYVKFNGYGNLQSQSYFGLVAELKEEIEEIVDIIIEKQNDLTLDDAIIEILES